MRLAIVHDYLNQMGGAERVLLELHALFPAAPIYTSIFAPAQVHPAFRQMDVRTTFMQHLPGVLSHHQAYLPLYPFAFENVDLRAYDVVLSMSSGWAKNVLTRPETCHVCYCLTPMRFGWNFQEYVAREHVTGWQRRALLPVIAALRLWDVAGSNRVDAFAAISSTVARRIWKYYRREAEVIFPPVDTSAYACAGSASENGLADGSYYLVVSRLVPYKRIDLAIEACRAIGAPLKIIGSGRDQARLERLAAGADVEFLGSVDDATKRCHLDRCRAFLFPSEEDFGIAPLEATAAGRPVVALAAGGALDTVVDGETGVLFDEQTVEALVAALRRAEAVSWDRRRIAEHAAGFDRATFRSRLLAFVERSAEAHRLAAARRATVALPVGVR